MRAAAWWSSSLSVSISFSMVANQLHRVVQYMYLSGLRTLRLHPGMGQRASSCCWCGGWVFVWGVVVLRGIMFGLMVGSLSVDVCRWKIPRCLSRGILIWLKLCALGDSSAISRQLLVLAC